MTEIKIKVNEIVIKNEETGHEAKVKTVRGVQFLADYIQETEKEALADKLEEVANTKY